MSSEEGACCKHISSSSASQSLEEMEFERGIWSAALNGEIERVQMMLDKGVDPNKRDRFGYTALHYAARNGHSSVCRLLIERGADVNALTHGEASPLHRAAHQGHEEIVEMLLKKGSNPFQSDSDGKTALHKAAEQYHFNVAKILVEKHDGLKYQRDKCYKVPQDYVDPNCEEQLFKLLLVEDLCN